MYTAKTSRRSAGSTPARSGSPTRSRRPFSVATPFKKHGSSASARPARASSGPARSHGSAASTPFKRAFYGAPTRSTSPSRARRPFASAARPYRGGGGGGRPSGGYRGKGKQKTERIDFSRFINKAQTLENAPIFIPTNNFADFKLDPRVKKSIASHGYTNPTPIQDQVIPLILEGKDVVGMANTGTGKTAAFLIPFINKILLNNREKVIIIAPTRELAIQIDDELKKFTRGIRLFSVCCVGGTPIYRQITQLRGRYNFIIGTPGRIKDLMTRRMIRTQEIKNVVLDEADRMLDMGFSEDIRLILSDMPKDRQTLCFSATIPPEIDRLIKEFLQTPAHISVKTQDVAINIEQDVLYIQRGQNKIDALYKLLDQQDLTKVLIFGRTKHGVEKLSDSLVKKGFKSESIHGDKTQGKRQFSLKMFKDNHARILVATDVAARGLDIADISHVINYDLPATNDDYIHRIGRTGRGVKKGKAITFVDR